MHVVTCLGASAAAAALCAGLVVAASTNLPKGDDVTVAIARAPQAEGATVEIVRRVADPVSVLAVALPPETPEVHEAVAASLEPAHRPSLIEETGGFSAFAMSGGFELRPAFQVENAGGFGRSSSEAVAEADEGDVAVTVVGRVVAELPPPRPSLLSREEARTASIAILQVLPPARPETGRLQFASADATLPLPADPAPDASAPAQPQTQTQPGLFGLFNSFAHPGTAETGKRRETGIVQTGIASWYGPGFHGRRTASGERFNQNELTAAHRTLPFGTKVRVIDEETGRSIVVRINDRGPFTRGRIIDLSRASAQALGAMSLRRVKVVAAEE